MTKISKKCHLSAICSNIFTYSINFIHHQSGFMTKIETINPVLHFSRSGKFWSVFLKKLPKFEKNYILNIQVSETWDSFFLLTNIYGWQKKTVLTHLVSLNSNVIFLKLTHSFFRFLLQYFKLLQFLVICILWFIIS